MTKHSTIVGGSTAGRLINCPASHQTILALPPSVQIPSEYAEEGTFAHAVMDALMHARQQGLDPKGLSGTARSWVTRPFHDRKLTYEHVDTMIAPALEYLAGLEARYGGGFSVAGVEQRVRFPGLPGAFGTIDLILISEQWVLHVDWKFGQGVGVAAVYSDDDGAIVNAQLMFYLAAARHTLKRLYGKRKLAIAIIQPRGVEPLTHTEVARAEVKYFVEDVHDAVIDAIGRDPVRARGEWCRFAPCKVACPLWTGPLLDLSALTPVQRDDAVPPGMHRFVDANGPPDGPRPAPITAYGAYLAKAKVLVDSLAMLKADIDKQMHTYLEAGGVIPGWRLKAKVKQRQWIEGAEAALYDLGFSDDDVWQEPKLATFQQADAAAKKLGVKIPEHLRVAPPTTETTIATTSDPAPVVEPHVAIEQFRAALQQLTQERTP